MRQHSNLAKDTAEKVVKDIRRATRGGGKDPDRFGRPARRGQHRRAVPPRGYRAEPVLSLVEGFPGGWQEAAMLHSD